MKCRYCKGSNTIKKGIRKKLQRYYCKRCKKYFQNKYNYKAYRLNINELIIKLLKESCGIRSISRILNISCGTVLSRILKISDQVKIPYFNTLGCNFEVDELGSVVKKVMS